MLAALTFLVRAMEEETLAGVGPGSIRQRLKLVRDASVQTSAVGDVTPQYGTVRIKHGRPSTTPLGLQLQSSRSCMGLAVVIGFATRAVAANPPLTLRDQHLVQWVGFDRLIGAAERQQENDESRPPPREAGRHAGAVNPRHW